VLECPLVASVHGGSRDVIEDGVNGLLVDHNDIAQLADAAVKIVQMGGPARQEMGRRARQTILEGYTWDRIARRLLSLYAEF